MPSGTRTTRRPAQKISHATASVVATPTSVKQNLRPRSSRPAVVTVLGPSVSHSLTMMPRMKKSTSISRTTLAIALSERFRNGWAISCRVRPDSAISCPRKSRRSLLLPLSSKLTKSRKLVSTSFWPSSTISNQKHRSS